ncbi:MAG: hypothetical protein WD273_12370 [Trueperaceae bacterium]
MSYQLERELQERVSRYHNEAAVRRHVPASNYRHAVAVALRRLADRLEPRQLRPGLSGERAPVAFEGRNH